MQEELNGLLLQLRERLLEQTDDFRRKYRKQLHDLTGEVIDRMQADLTCLSDAKGGSRENQRP